MPPGPDVHRVRPVVGRISIQATMVGMYQHLRGQVVKDRVLLNERLELLPISAQTVVEEEYQLIARQLRSDEPCVLPWVVNAGLVNKPIDVVEIAKVVTYVSPKLAIHVAI